MESILQGFPNVQVYLDDIIVTEKENDTSVLRQVFQRLREHKLKLNKAKCQFRGAQVSFLGHRIDAKGLHPLQDNFEVVLAAPKPTSVNQLKSFLGLVTYYAKFLPNLSTTLAPLYRLLAKGVLWRWGPSQDSAFREAKSGLEQLADSTSEDLLLRQVKTWILCGWPNQLGPEQQCLQPYFTRRYELTTEEMEVLVQGENISQEEFGAGTGWRTVGSKKQAVERSNASSFGTHLGTGGRKKREQKLKQQLIKASRMPYLPKGDFKIIIRPKGGLNIGESGAARVASCVYQAAGIPGEHREDDTVCLNVQQNIIVVSTPSEANADRYQCVERLVVNGQAY
nr:uncharacterized protein LOC126535413 [Dermacentor andersoni]